MRELSIEIEKFYQSIYEQDAEGLYKVDKQRFLEDIVYVEEIKDEMAYGKTRFKYHFMNRRLNSKFHSTYKKVAKYVDIGTFYQMAYEKIVRYVNELEDDYVGIGYNRQDDDIGYMVLLIDRRCYHETLEENGVIYDRSAGKYVNHLHNAVELNSDLDNEGSIIERIDLISTEDIVMPVSESDESLERLQTLIDNVGLTNRQKEVIEVLMYCEFNQVETAKELGVSKQSVHKVLNNIKDRFAKYYSEIGINIKPLKQLDNILDSEFEEKELFKFIVDNINDSDINFLVYEVDDEVRKPLIRFMNGKEVEYKEVKEFLVRFIEQYYKNNKIAENENPLEKVDFSIVQFNDLMRAIKEAV